MPKIISKGGCGRTVIELLVRESTIACLFRYERSKTSKLAEVEENEGNKNLRLK